MYIVVITCNLLLHVMATVPSVLVKEGSPFSQPKSTIMAVPVILEYNTFLALKLNVFNHQSQPCKVCQSHPIMAGLKVVNYCCPITRTQFSFVYLLSHFSFYELCFLLFYCWISCLSQNSQRRIHSLKEEEYNGRYET